MDMEGRGEEKEGGAKEVVQRCETLKKLPFACAASDVTCVCPCLKLVLARQAFVNGVAGASSLPEAN